MKSEEKTLSGWLEDVELVYDEKSLGLGKKEEHVDTYRQLQVLNTSDVDRDY